MRRARAAALALLLALGACAAGPLPEQASLPPVLQNDGVTDPARSAILSTAHVFNRPATLAGNPAEAATALGRLEFLAVELAAGPRWRDLDPLVAPLLARGREEARAAIGIRPGLPAQAAIDGLAATAFALRRNDAAAARQAMAGITAPGSESAALARLAALPPLPRTAEATARAQAALTRRDQQGNDRFDF